MSLQLGCHGLLRLGLPRLVNFAQDVLALRFPDVAFGVLVAVSQKRDDRVGQFAHGGEAAIPDSLRHITEETFDQVEPGRRGGREVHVEPGVFGQPCLDLGMLVRGVVVRDQMDGQVLGCLPVDLPEEGQPFLMPVLLGNRRDQLAFQIVQGSKEGERAVADIVMSHCPDMADSQRQAGLGAFQCLALGLLVTAQNQRLFRWVQIEPDDIPKLVFEVCIAGQLERAQQVRLDVVGRPQALNAGVRYAGRLRHAAATPAAARGRRLACRLDDLLDRSNRQCSLAPASRQIRQPGQPRPDKASAPMIDRHARDANLLANRILCLPFCSQQDNLRPLPIPYRNLAGSQSLRQFLHLGRFKHDSLSDHDHPPKAKLWREYTNSLKCKGICETLH